MAWTPDVWTGDARRALYEQLVRKFRPYSEWENPNSPGRGRDAEFEKFCDAFAATFGAKSAEAVKHQIRFAMPETSKGATWEKGHVQAAILNKAAALEAGFIEDKHLPSTLHSVGKEPSVPRTDQL